MSVSSSAAAAAAAASQTQERFLFFKAACPLAAEADGGIATPTRWFCGFTLINLSLLYPLSTRIALSICLLCVHSAAGS